jgi:quinoprotein glucose dehydrogenase
MITLDGKERDVVIQGTKQGLVFVLDRDTGEPALPVAERPVPQGGVPGEVLVADPALPGRSAATRP